MPRYETTDNGIEYDWWVTGPDGAHFALYPEPHHTKEDIDKAKAQLRRDHDVVSIQTKRKSD